MSTETLTPPEADHEAQNHKLGAVTVFEVLAEPPGVPTHPENAGKNPASDVTTPNTLWSDGTTSGDLD